MTSYCCTRGAEEHASAVAVLRPITHACKQYYSQLHGYSDRSLNQLGRRDEKCSGRR